MSTWILADRFAISAFAAILIMAAIWDAKTFRIPNRFSLFVLLAYPLHALLNPGAVPFALLTAAVMLAIGVALFARGWMGGGDVKLLTVCALWAGSDHIATFVLITGLVGAAMSLVMMSSYRFPLALALQRVGCARASEVLIGRAVPYGVAIAAGGVAVALALAAQTY
jgi:prepilin peptidase CpaA